MKVFFQDEGECIIINGDISVKVLEVIGDEVVLGIDAPEWMEIEEYDPSCLEKFSILQPR